MGLFDDFRPPALPQPQAANDYTADIDPATILRDPRFLKDLRAYYARNGKSFADDGELVKQFYTDRTWRNVNSVSMAKDLYEANTADPEQATRLGRIQKVWEAAPDRDFLDALPDYLMAGLADPVNLVGGAGGIKAGAAALRAGKTGMQAAGAAARVGAIQEGALNAGIAGGQDLLMQQRNVDLGLQDEVSQTRALGQAALGGAIGGALGGAIGAATVPTGMAANLAKRETKLLIERGYTPEQVAAMQPREVTNALKETVEAAKARLARAKAAGASAGTIKAYQRELANSYDALEEQARAAQEQMLARQGQEQNLDDQAAAQDAALAQAEYAQIVADADAARMAAGMERTGADPAQLPGGAQSAPQARRMAMGDEARQESQAAAGDAAAMTPDYVPTEDPNSAQITTPTPAATPAQAAAAPAGEGAPAPDLTNVKASPAAKAIIEQNGLDPATIEKNENGSITKAAAEAALANKQAGDEFDAATTPPVVNDFAKAAYDDLKSQVADLEAGRPELASMPTETRAAIFTALAREQYPTIADDITALAQASDWRMREFLGGLTDKEEQIINDFAASLRKQNPNLTAEEAKRQAAVAWIKFGRKGDLTKPAAGGPATSGARDTSLKPDGTAFEKNAGRSADPLTGFYKGRDGNAPQRTGGIQGIMKPGRAATEADPNYTVNDGQLPNKGQFNQSEDFQKALANGKLTRDEAMAVAEKDGRIMAFKARGFQEEVVGGQDIWKYTNRKGEERTKLGVKGGGLVFYNPYTKRMYASYELAAREGTTPAAKSATELDKLLEQAEAARDRADVLRASPKFDTDPAVSREYAAAVKEARALEKQIADLRKPAAGSPEQGAATTPEVASPPPAPTSLPADLADAINKGTLSRALGDLVRAKKAGSAEASTAALSHPPAPAGYRLAARNTADPQDVRVMDPADAARGAGVETLIGRDNPKDWQVGVVPDRADLTTGSAAAANQFKRFSEVGEASTEPLTTDELKAIKFGDALSEEEMQQVVDAMSFAASLKGAVVKATVADIRDRTADGLFALWQRLEAAPWLAKQSDLLEQLKHITNVNKAIAKIAPNGVKLPSQTRAAAIRDLETALEGFSPEEIALGRKLLERATSDRAPLISGDRNDQGGAFRFGPATGGGFSNSITIGTKLGTMPSTFRFAHEFAHWAYVNLLTPGDRAEFWEGIQSGFYQNGRANMNRIVDNAPLAAETRAGAQQIMSRTNFLESPQEMFANQFATWLHRKEGGIYTDENFWKRVTFFFKAIFDKLVGNKAVDPDLEKFFTRIYPDDVKPAKNLPPSISSEAGRAILEIYTSAHIHRTMMGEAIAAGSADAIVEAAKDLAVFFRSASPKRLRGIMNQRSNELLRALNSGANTDKLGEMPLEEIKGIVDEIVGNVSDPEEAAARITAMWTPKGPDDYKSVSNALDLLSSNMEKQFRRVVQQGGADPDAITLPTMAPSFRNELEADAARRKADRDAMYERKKAREAVAGQKAATAGDATATADQVKSMPTADRAMLPAGKPGPDAKSMSEAQLILEITSNKGTQRAIAAAQRLIELRRSRPLPAQPVKITREIFSARAPDLQKMLVDAFDAGDRAKVDQVLYEVQRRASSTKVQPLFSIMNRDIADKVELEIAQNSDAPNYDGIPAGAPATIREALSYMTHRDPQLQVQLRTLAYRMLNLAGKTARENVESAQFISMEDLALLTGRAPQPGESGAFIDFSSSDFSSLRGELRRLTIALDRGSSNPLDLIHEVGHLLVRTGVLSDTDTIVRGFELADDAIKSRVMAAYASKYTSLDDVTRNVRMAEEWYVEQFANYLGERAARGDIFKLRDDVDSITQLELRGRLSSLIDRLVEAMAYLLNGLVGRNDVKQDFRRLFLYGDMFAARAEKKAPLNALGYDGYAVHASLGPTYAQDAWNRLSPAQKERVREFAGNTRTWDTENDRPIPYFHGTPNITPFKDPDVVFKPSDRGDFGPGIYLTRNANVAGEVYAKNPTGTSLRQAVERLRTANRIDNEQLATATAIVDQMTALRRRAGVLSRDVYQGAKLSQKTGNDTVDLINATVESQRNSQERNLRELAAVLADLDAGAEYLKGIGVDMNPGVIPTYISPRNPFDGRDGRYEELVEGVIYRDTVDLFTARATVNRELGMQGYDSILSKHVNPLETGQLVSHEVYTLIDHMAPDGSAIKASQLVKHVKAAMFDRGDERLRYSALNSPVPNAGTVAQALAEGADLASPTLRSGVLDAMDRAGMPSSLTNAVSNILKKRTATANDRSAFDRFMTATLGENAVRLEKAKLNWLGGFLRTHFPDHQQELAGKLFGSGKRAAILSELRKLPDAPSDLRRWFENASSWRGPAKQPESFARIVSALRRDNLGSLSADEQQVAQAIRRTLGQELEEMRAAGMHVGEVSNYFPQLWRPDAIAERSDEFRGKLADYFQDEARSVNETLERTVAEKKAADVIARLTSEDGFYTPPPLGSQRQATSDNVDFQRLIRLEKPEFRKHLDALEPFLESDLEGLLVKYFDGTTRRLQQHKQFGLLNHGAYDYLRVAEEGEAGITYLLAHNRIVRKAIKSRGENGWVETSMLSESFQMPFEGDEVRAREFVATLVREHQKSGDAAARQMLQQAMPDYATLEGRAKQTYDRRVDAIVAALRDFGGQARVVPATDIEFAEKTLQVAMRKPVENGLMAGDAARTVSRGLRTFNSVTLLGFTVLSSLGDVVLPLIRSGEFGAYQKALTTYARDPDYRASFERLGVTMESIVHQKMAGLFEYDSNGRLNQFSNAFFNAVGLTPWTDVNRKMAGAVGYEMFKVDIDKAVNLKVGDGSDIAAQRPEYRRIMRRLNKYGLGDYVLRNQALPPAGELDDPVARTAIMRFVNDTIFAPNPNDIPLWAQTPVGSIMFQLKSFPLMMARLSKDVLVNDVREFLKTGDTGYLKRPGYFLMIGPAFGAGALATADVVRGRGGEKNREHELQNRNVLKTLGFNQKIHGDEDTFLGWYMSGMLQMGGLGLIAESLMNAAAQVDNGAYGTQRIMSLFLGPSVGTVQSGVNVLGGVKDAALGLTPDSNAKERTAAREAIQRVPIVGGISSVREPTIDAIAGEAQ